MKKFIITCPSCHKKMKVLDKAAKYKCPSCGSIYKISSLKLVQLRIKGFFTGIADTGRDIKNNIKYKISSARTTYNYMKQLRKNMKNDPNWSNYHREQREMKNTNKRSFKDFFKRK